MIDAILPGISISPGLEYIVSFRVFLRSVSIINAKYLERRETDLQCYATGLSLDISHRISQSGNDIFIQFCDEIAVL